MYVCLCSGVTTAQIIQCVQSGCKDLDAVTETLGVGMNCGSCIYMISDLIEKTVAKNSIQPTNVPHNRARDFLTNVDD
ncbi:MAG: bacterioferritin [Gammaproteobacteria bacterium]|nr:bacterioferritin [Gammaproteobacteria bacterium]MYF39002.1 bacterioferritin [Gammaproteobacteria bacterium]